MSTWRVIFSSLCFGVPVSATLLGSVGYVARIEGQSMQPLLNPNPGKSNDYIVLNIWGTRLHKYRRGEIVSLASPTDPKFRIIKRIIALPGDTIETFTYKQRILTVPKGYCWIEGDNRRASFDSNSYGPVPISLITAKASYIIWPPSRWQNIGGTPVTDFDAESRIINTDTLE